MVFTQMWDWDTDNNMSRSKPPLTDQIYELHPDNVDFDITKIHEEKNDLSKFHIR